MAFHDISYFIFNIILMSHRVFGNISNVVVVLLSLGQSCKFVVCCHSIFQYFNPEPNFRCEHDQ
jgi:hypothetical protein